MLRFYFSQIVGSGATEDGFRAAAADVLVASGEPVNYGVDDLRVDETNAAGWMIVWADVSATQHALLVADARVSYMPFEDALGNPLGPNDLVGLIPEATRDVIRARLESRHVPMDGIVLTDPIRRVVARIIRRVRIRRALRADDISEGLDLQIRDIPSAKRSRISSALLAAGYDSTAYSNTTTIREALRRLIVQDVRANANGWD